jgi:serine/threonine-protein kinase
MPLDVRIDDDLPDRILAILGAEYAIERELERPATLNPFDPTEMRFAVPTRTFVVRNVPFGWRAFIRVLVAQSRRLSIREFKSVIEQYAHLRHPNILPIEAVGEDRGDIYYTMSFVDGDALSTRLAHDGKLPLPEAVRVLRDVAAALSYAHARGAVHRSLASVSIIVDAVSGRALVADFGAVVGYVLADGGSHEYSLVAFGEWPLWERPYKCVEDSSVDLQTDLHSLGVIAYRMLSASYPTRAYPPPGWNPEYVVSVAFIRGPIAPLPSSVPDALRELVMALLEERVEDRPQSADEVLAALDALSLADASHVAR